MAGTKFILLFVINTLSSLIAASFWITTNPTNVFLKKDLLITCTTDEPYVLFQIIPNTTVCMINGSNFKGTCRLMESNITYYIYTYKTTKNYTITIPGNLVTEKLHNTQWICRNPFNGNSSYIIKLYIIIPVTRVQITTTPVNSNPVQIVNGTSHVFNCTTNSARPSSRIEWFLSSTNLTSNATLQQGICSTNCSNGKVISSSILEYTGHIPDDGKYIYCTASNTYEMDSIRSQNRTILIRYGPKVVILSPSTQTYITNENGSVGSISCEADCKPNCTIEWDGPHIRNSNQPILDLQNLNRNQSGEYKCKASNYLGSSKSNTVFVSVNYGPKVVILSPSTQTYITNETDSVGSISCKADCKPNCTIQWNGPHIRNSSQPILDLQNINRNQSGEYQCTARNYLGSSKSTTVFVSVNYGPSQVILSPTHLSYTVNEAGRVSPISCTADCRPNCTFEWSGPNLSSNTQSVLNLRNISRHQMGEYNCTASNFISDATSSTVNINVHYGPEQVILSPVNSSYTVNETGSVSPISCTADCRPNCTFGWNGPNLSSDEQIVLNLQNISRNQTGKYNCTARNFISNATSITVNVYVQYGPQEVIITPRTPFYTVNETENVDPIYCSADCEPNCTFSWVGPYLPSRTTSVLNLQNIGRNQSGPYQCTAENVVSSAKSITVMISVNYGPVHVIISPSTHSYTVEESGNVGPISCTADCKPQCNISWKEPNMLSSSPVLNITNISRSQIGVYYCIAENAIGYLVSSNVVISVNLAPRLSQLIPNSRSIITLDAGSSLNITVQLIARPPPQIDWIFQRNGEHLDIDRDTHNTFGEYEHATRLYIATLRLNDFGFYIMTATNVLGSFSMNFTVSKENEYEKSDVASNDGSLIKAGSAMISIGILLMLSTIVVILVYRFRLKKEKTVSRPNEYEPFKTTNPAFTDTYDNLDRDTNDFSTATDRRGASADTNTMNTYEDVQQKAPKELPIYQNIQIKQKGKSKKKGREYVNISY